MSAKSLDIELDQISEQIGLRSGDTKGDALVRAMQSKFHLEQSYKTVYGGLAKYLEALRQSAEDTEGSEAEIQELMRKTVLLCKAGIRIQETTVNEIVPGSFPAPVDEPTSSLDFDCNDARALAHAICVVSLPAGQPEICLAVMVIAAIYCL